MSQRTRAITQFADAVSAAAGLEALYGRFAAAALLDDEDGTILDMRPFTGEATCVVCALEWALDVADDWRSAHRVVLLSGGGGSLRDLREDDIRMYQGLREALDDTPSSWSTGSRPTATRSDRSRSRATSRRTGTTRRAAS